MTERSEHSAGGVPVRSIAGEWHVLVIKDPYGNWGLPKGHLEGDEGPPEAALREVAEETGLEVAELGPEVNTIDWYFRRGGERIHKICTFFLMHAPVGEAVPEEGEGISACEWLPIEAAAERVTYLNTREVVREAARTLEAMTW